MLEAESNTTEGRDLLSCIYAAQMYIQCVRANTHMYACMQRLVRGEVAKAAGSEREHDEKGGESQGVLKI